MAVRRDRAPEGRRSFWVFIAAFVSLGLLSVAWTFTSPLSSGPDESGHVMKAAATVRGQLVGHPTDTVGLTTFDLPADIGDVGAALTCFAGHTDRTAACAPSQDSLPSGTVAVATGVGSYNPVYYALVGWPSLLVEGRWSSWGMRLASGVLSSLMLAAAFWAASRAPGGRWMIAGLAVAVTPMTLYLGTMVNANGLEATGCAAVAALSWAVVHRREGPRRAEAVVLAVVVVLTASARTTSPLLVLLIVAAVLATAPRGRLAELVRDRSVVIAAAATVVGVVPALLWSLLVAVPGGYIPSSDPVRPTPVIAALHSLRSLGDYGRGMIGVLGWQDTRLPEPVVTGWIAGIGAAVLLGCAAGRRGLVAVGLLAAGVLLLPAVVQAGSAAKWGYIWQGRYGLGLLVGLVLVSFAVAGRTALRRSAAVPVTAVLWSAWGVAQLTVLVWTYGRYSVGGLGTPGAASSWRQALTGIGWQAPTGSLVPWFVIAAIGAGGLLVVAVFAVAPARRRRSGTEQGGPDGDTAPADAPVAPTVA
jgi:hypothetical protein